MLKELSQKDFKLKIIEDLGTKFITRKSSRKVRRVIFECPDCLEPFETSMSDVKNGKSLRCITCSKGEQHGEKGTKLYMVWEAMRKRCRTKTNRDYPRYGGRGISVYNDWNESFISFKKWADTNGYAEGLSIDRINNNGNYEPANCRWVTPDVQAANQRFKKNNSGVLGVYKYNNTDMYYSTIRVQGITTIIIKGVSIDEARKARNDYIEYHKLPHTKS